MSTAVPQNLSQLKLEIYQLSQKKPFTKEDSSRAEILLKLLESRDDHQDSIRELKHRALAAEFPSGPSEFRMFLVGKRGERNGDGSQLILRGHYEHRDMGTGTGSGPFGSTLAPAGFFGQVVAGMKAVDGIFAACRWIPTERGGKFAIPTIDDTSATAVQVTENSQSTAVDIATISAAEYDENPYWRSGVVKLSINLVQDSAVDLESLFAEAFSIRFARGIGASFITTLLSGATVGATAAGDPNAGSPSGVTQIGYPDLIALVDSLDSAYTEAPNAGWLMRRATLNKIAQLTDQQGRPLDLIHFKGTYYLLGWPVRISPSMPAIAASAKTVAFGDLSRFIAVHVGDSFETRRYTERFIDFGQFGVEAFWRVRGALADTAAIVVLQQHS